MRSLFLCSFTFFLLGCGHNRRSDPLRDARGDGSGRDGYFNHRDAVSLRDTADVAGDRRGDAADAGDGRSDGAAECVADCECPSNCLLGHCIESDAPRLGLCAPDGDCRCVNGRCDERECCIKPDGEVATFLSPECTGADPRKMELACDELVWGCPADRPYCCDTYRDDDPGPRLCYEEPVAWEMMYGICIERTPDGMEARCELEYRNCPRERTHCCGLYRGVAPRDPITEVCADHPVRGWMCSSPP